MTILLSEIDMLIDEAESSKEILRIVRLLKKLLSTADMSIDLEEWKDWDAWASDFSDVTVQIFNKEELYGVKSYEYEIHVVVNSIIKIHANTG